MTLTLRLPLGGETTGRRLDMPNQDLTAPFTDGQAPGIRTGSGTRILRLVVLAVPMGVSGVLGWSSLGWFAIDGPPGAIEGILVGVSVVAFYWVALSFCTALLGLFWRPAVASVPTRGLNVAILLPMFAEPATPTIGAAIALLEGLEARGKGLHRFSLHVLSDTRDPSAVLLEEAELAAIRLAHPRLAMSYRHRWENVDYKSGNIRDWVVAQGDGYDAMLILDADSVMTPDSVLHMADLMAVEPGLGLIQTTPRVLPGETLWQRVQCFASEVYGLNLSRGFAMWAGNEANFLGHNALARTRAFAACAGLPHLSGQAPRGGVILSHDFVEAALIRRAGWGVRLVPEAKGSFEATPETLLGYLRRDRRWCQGNLQHLRLLSVPGLHPVSRFHLLQGAMAYLSSVWWMILLLLWVIAGQGSVVPAFFSENPFMPDWPDYPAFSQASLVGVVFLMLLGPKVAGVVAHIRDRGLTLAQAPYLGLSVLAEITLSILIAPALMVQQVRAVLRTLAGFDGGWVPHAACRPGLAALTRFHAIETSIGIGLVGLVTTGHLTIWLLPVGVCLLLAVPLSWLVQQDAGQTWLLRPLPEEAK